jgi:hypothetical protein
MVDRDVLLKILEKNAVPPTPPVGERCLSLRCKGMYLNHGLGQTELVAGDGNFWCGKTQRVFGPDDQFVGDGECRHTGRSCYEGV